MGSELPILISSHVCITLCVCLYIEGGGSRVSLSLTGCQVTHDHQPA